MSVRLEVRDRNLSETFLRRVPTQPNLTSRGAPTSRMGMTTVWRPRVRIAVPDVGDAENTDTSREESTKKGTKRKRAPPTKGPCEHGVKTRSNVQGVQCLSARSSRRQCKECGGAVQSASTVVCALIARSAVGHQSASTVVSAYSARSAVGLNLRARSSALQVQGVRWVQESASTVVYANSARSAAGHQSASTVVCALSARSAVGHQSASTVVSATTARSVVVQEYASTVGGAIDARSVLD